MAIFISGFSIPASSLVDEKQKRTIGALLITPVTQLELFMAKGSIGIIISMIMGVTILLLNHALNGQLGLLILILFLGAMMACSFGLMLGAHINDMGSLYSVIKGLGIFLYGPGIVAMFPQIPQWIGKLFPTYYVMNPIFELTKKSSNWSNLKVNVFILIGFLVIFFAIVGRIAHKRSQTET